jgi:hypothetical protein
MSSLRVIYIINYVTYAINREFGNPRPLNSEPGAQTIDLIGLEPKTITFLSHPISRSSELETSG